MTAPDAPLPAPTQQDYFEAAQCWCDPTTSALVMEPKLALVIAKALARARHAGEVAERERTKALVEAARAWTTGCDGKGMCRAQSCCDTCSQPERVMALKSAITAATPEGK